MRISKSFQIPISLIAYLVVMLVLNVLLICYGYPPLTMRKAELIVDIFIIGTCLFYLEYWSIIMSGSKLSENKFILYMILIILPFLTLITSTIRQV